MNPEIGCENGRSGTACRKPYSKPHIEDYGSVVELTGTASGTNDDGGGFAQRSGGAG